MIGYRIALAAAGFWLAAGSANAAVTFHTSEASFAAAAAGATLIEDFSSITPKDTPLGPFTHGIATFTPLAGVPSLNLWVTGPAYLYSNFGVNNGVVAGNVLTSDGDEDIRVDFSVGVNAVGFDGYLNGLGGGTVYLLNGTSTVGTYALPNPSSGGRIYLGAVSDTAFTGFRWSTIGGGQLNTGIDNISVQTIAAVPEPSTWALMTIGLAACGWTARRRPATT